MRKKPRNPFLGMPAAALLVLSAAVLLPCSARAQQTSGSEETEASSGAQLWSENCGHCHNKRSPEKFSDAQWDVIVHHMRVRANLTGSDARAIAEFLKSAN